MKLVIDLDVLDRVDNHKELNKELEQLVCKLSIAKVKGKLIGHELFYRDAYLERNLQQELESADQVINDFINSFPKAH